MTKNLHLLSVESNEEETLRQVDVLTASGLVPSWERVETAEQFRASLASGQWDLILSDFALPAFSARGVLEVLREALLDVPVIVVSGTPGEETAVECIKAGAQDFVRKDAMGRLPGAVQRALADAQAHKRLRSSLQLDPTQHERMLESITDYAIFSVSVDGTLSSWSPAVQRLLGYDAAQFVGHPVTLLFPPEELAAGVAEVELRTAKERGRFHVEGRRLRRDGSEFWASTSIAPIRDEHGEFKGYSKVIRDVTERKKLIDELQRAVRQRDEFLSVASHELKTPLTSLQLQLQSTQRMLSTEGAADPLVGRVAQKVSASLRYVERLGRLINELLEVSRLQSGQLRLFREEMDCSELVREVAARLEPMRAASGCSLKLELESPVHVYVDPLRFESVVTNLLTNAIKFGAPSPIEVQLAREGEDVLLRVTDFGIGIPEADQERIFQRFERAVSENNYGGFGVGLWIVQQIMEAHGGTVKVASRPGRGTTFTVRWPARANL